MKSRLRLGAFAGCGRGRRLRPDSLSRGGHLTRGGRARPRARSPTPARGSDAQAAHADGGLGHPAGKPNQITGGGGDEEVDRDDMARVAVRGGQRCLFGHAGSGGAGQPGGVQHAARRRLGGRVRRDAELVTWPRTRQHGRPCPYVRGGRLHALARPIPRCPDARGLSPTKQVRRPALGAGRRRALRRGLPPFRWTRDGYAASLSPSLPWRGEAPRVEAARAMPMSRFSGETTSSGSTRGLHGCHLGSLRVTSSPEDSA
jgi:hypothetical protein